MSKVLHKTVGTEKVIIGEFRADIEADREAEKKIGTVFSNVNVITTIEGKKLIPIQELNKLERQLTEEKQAAEKKGYNDGYEKGLKVGHREAQEVVNNFASLLVDAKRQRDVLFDEAHHKILELVFKIARKVTFNAAALDPEITAAIISGTIEKLVDKSKIKVKVSPDHLPMIEQQVDRFKGNSNAVKAIEIEPDGRVRYGGCFIETPTGDIDARIDSQMEIIARTLNADGDGQ